MRERRARAYSSAPRRANSLAAGFAALVLLGTWAPLGAAQVTPITNSTVTISATVVGVSEFFMTIRRRDNPSVMESTVTFGTQTGGGPAWSTLPDQFVELSVDSDNPSWRLRAYTENVFVGGFSTTTWGYSAGGLVGNTSQGAKVAMAWKCSTTTVTNPPTGDPALGLPASNGWTFFKDKVDQDDPSFGTDNPLTPINEADESFDVVDQLGYLNIAFGSNSYTRVVVSEVGPAEGFSVQLANRKDSFRWFVEADFSNAPADDYSGVLKLELIHQ